MRLSVLIMFIFGRGAEVRYDSIRSKIATLDTVFANLERFVATDRRNIEYFLDLSGYKE